MSELTQYIDAILAAYSGVPDEEANQPMTLTVPVRDLRVIAKALRPEVRDGWKLVPIEPTSDMIDAGGNTPKMQVLDGYCSDAQLRGCFTEDRLAGPKSDCAIAQCWKAMLAASPQSQDA